VIGIHGTRRARPLDYRGKVPQRGEAPFEGSHLSFGANAKLADDQTTASPFDPAAPNPSRILMINLTAAKGRQEANRSKATGNAGSWVSATP
jgi:hypothetical protein